MPPGATADGRGPLTSVLVTGARGRLGTMVVEDLRTLGLRVIEVDRAPGGPDAESYELDLLTARIDAGLLGRCDAVVHLAALPDLSYGEPQEILIANLSATARVLFDAMDAGVKTFLYASSQCVLGLPFAERVIVPDYAPVDELHPCRPEDAYGLSKLAGETFCDMAARRYGASIACFRFPAVWDPRRRDEHVATRGRQVSQSAKSLWAYIDVRDAVLAIRAWLLAPTPGLEIFNVAAPWPFADIPIQAAMEQAYGALPPGARELGVAEAPFSSRKIEAALGFRASKRWHADRIEDAP